MNGKPVIGLGERYRPGEIVVDLEHRPVVERLLRESKFTQVSTFEELPRLGLALLSVKDIAQVPQKIPGFRELKLALAEDRKDLKLSGDPSNLDVLMRHLRQQASRAYAGWTPYMGKNRVTELIEGLPHWGGGVGVPQPTGAVKIPPRPKDGGSTLRVGILDTRLAPSDKFDGRCWTSFLVGDEQPYRPWQGHATFVAGRILMRAPDAELHVRPGLGDVDGRTWSWEVAKRMADFLDSGVQILNLSFGGFTDDGMPPFVFERAINRLSAEMLLVAAAGNHGSEPAHVDHAHQDSIHVPRTPDSPIWPAAMPNVVAVGARDAVGRVARFTPPGVPWLDLVAPGVNVHSTFLDGKVQAQVEVMNPADKSVHVDDKPPVRFYGAATWSGTSFAAADATGEIAKVALVRQCTARSALEIIRGREPGRRYSVHRPPW